MGDGRPGETEAVEIGEPGDPGIVLAAAGIVEDDRPHPRSRRKIGRIDAAMGGRHDHPAGIAWLE
jgi:hypothetical protein